MKSSRIIAKRCHIAHLKMPSMLMAMPSAFSLT